MNIPSTPHQFKHGASTTLILSPEGRRPLALPLTPGQLVVVTDSSGILPNDWEQSLANPTPQSHITPRARFIQDGDVVAPEKLLLVGFDRPLPDLPVREYLATFCSDVDAILKEFELSDVATLSCAYLPPAPARQIALLHALSHERAIIVVSDPFLPFNGRWRESFAAFVLEQATLGSSIVVCAHVGFFPKTWTSNPAVITKDVASLLPVPAEQRESKMQSALAMKNHSSAPSGIENRDALENIVVPRETNELNEKYYIPGTPLPIPPGAIKVFKTTKDWVFAPLAAASKFLRTWSGAVVTGGLAFVLVSMGIIFVPNLPQSHAILQAISKKFNYTWSDILQQKTPAAGAPQSPSDPTTEGESPSLRSIQPLTEPTTLDLSDDQSTTGDHLPIFTWNTLPLALQLPENLTPHLRSTSDEHDFLAPWHVALQAIERHSSTSVSSDEAEGAAPAPEATTQEGLPLSRAISSHLSLLCPPFEECSLWEVGQKE